MVHPVIFDKINASLIRSTVLRTVGSFSPSGMDAKSCSRICTFYKRKSGDLCHSLTLMAKRLATSYVDPDGSALFLARRLVALDKIPGVCPIGVCKTPRGITAKVTLVMTGQYIQEVAGSMQHCAGQPAGVEAVAWSML